MQKADNYIRSIILFLGVCVALAIALTIWNTQQHKSAAADKISIPLISSMITKSVSYPLAP